MVFDEEGKEETDRGEGVFKVHGWPRAKGHEYRVWVVGDRGGSHAF